MAIPIFVGIVAIAVAVCFRFKPQLAGVSLRHFTDRRSNMRFPAVFVNHGGGPMPLLGKQPALVQNMKDVVKKHLPQRSPKAVVVLSAHWESNPIEITSASKPPMVFDYYGFPPETYQYDYPAPGSPDLAQRIHEMLKKEGVTSKLNSDRGYDHGVFIPLMIMYPKAEIPVVCVSLHSSLNAETNMNIGKALAPLRDEDVLILGSGYAFHNLQVFLNPSQQTVQASIDFNKWLKKSILEEHDARMMLESLKKWETAPGARICHPREEHLLPLLMVAAAGTDRVTSKSDPKLVYDTIADAKTHSEHAVTGYIFN